MFKRILAIVTACMLMLTAVAFGEAVPAGVTGEFTGTAKGMGGDVTVTIGLKDGEIVSCTAEGPNETPGIGDKAIAVMPGEIAESGSIAVDTVSSATVTSTAILEAAAAALEAAGLNPDDYRVVVENNEETTAEDATYDCDIVIVGAGGAGLPAGVRALDEGVSVLFVDANYDCGGRCALSGGNLHSGCGTKIQEKYGIEDSADKYYEDHTTPECINSIYGDRNVVRSVADHMAEAYEYILDKGVLVKDVEPMHLPDYTEGGDQPETVGRWTYADQTTEDWVSYADYLSPSQEGAYQDRCGIAVTRPLERTAREAGAQFLLNYHMDKLYREGVLEGRVLGIQAHYSPTILPGEDAPLAPLSPFSDGNIEEAKETVNVRANKAVIIATGGSTGNVYFRTMIDARRGVEYDCTSGDPFCPKDASGEIAAMAIGACLGDIANQVIGDSFLTKAAMIGTQYTDSFATVQPTSPLFKLSRATGLRVYDWSNLLQVNMLGERFANEADSSTEWNGAALASVLTVDPSDGELHRYGGPLWTIFDSKAVEREGVGYRRHDR